MSFALLGGGCDDVINAMRNQPRYEALEPSQLPGQATSARHLVEGTVARSDRVEIDGYLTGWSDGAPLQQSPVRPTMAVLGRGRERYNIFCAPCHGLDGYGQGMIVRRGYTPPPSFHEQRSRLLPDGFIFSVITEGFGRMPSYAAQVPPDDRWAIVAYIRALQLSQHAAPELLDERRAADAEEPGR